MINQSIEVEDLKPVQVQIHIDDRGKSVTEIGGSGNPWADLFVMMEGLGLMRHILEKEGITTHNGKPLRDYIVEAIDKAYEANTFVGKLTPVEKT